MTTLPSASYLHGLKLIEALKLKEMRLLIDSYSGDIEAAYWTSESRLKSLGLDTTTISHFLEKRPAINLSEEVEKLSKNSIGIISYNDGVFPELLHQIPDPPLLLYYRGAIGLKDEACIAIVGTRKISEYGRAVVPAIAKGLVGCGVTIVSGLAYGIDAAAHRVAVQHNKRTIAVVASGLLDQDLYPKEHISLAQHIITSGGLILSEYPPGTPALKQHFIARNRIIAGLSVGTVVVECAIKSGALITARFALEQNRSVYAVPGSIFSVNSAGPNRLLQQGAIPITAATDILQDLNLVAQPSLSSEPLSDLEQKIIEEISADPKTLGELAASLDIPFGELSASLSLLEIKDLVRSNGSGQYAATL